MHILLAVLVFLCPIGIYCFFLASINQRPKPLLVNGRWDAVGLLFALSGFFLVMLPTLFAELYTRFEIALLSEFTFDPSWLLWIAYYLAVASGAWWVILGRANRTVIYQVDPQRLPGAVEQAAARLGLAVYAEKDRLILAREKPALAHTAITETPPANALPAEGDRLGTIYLDIFPILCHVTLRWEKCTSALRLDLERELEKTLTLAAPDDNPAAGWFLSVAGMVFGALLLVVLTFVFLVFLHKI